VGAGGAALKQYARRFSFKAVFSAVHRKMRGSKSNRTFGPLLRLHGTKASRRIDALTDALEEYLSTGADAAAETFWKAFIRLNKLAEKLPPGQRNQVSLELVWRMQAVLALETSVARIARAKKIVKHSGALQSASKALAAGVTAAGKAAGNLPNPAALVALGKLKAAVRRSNRALWAVWKRFDQVVPPDHPGVVQVLRRIEDDVDLIRQMLKKGDFKRLDDKHLWTVRGWLGEAYALMSKVWLKEKDKLLREAEAEALKRGPGWTAHYMTQLEHALDIGGREGPDGVVVLLNHTTREVVLHAVAQVKIEKTLTVFTQLYQDLRRFLGQEGVRGAETFGFFRFQLPSGTMSEEYRIIGGAMLPKLHVLSAADSVASKSQLDFLRDASGPITELKLDLTVNQLSRLAIGSIEAIVKYF
jgi:hypothetical protein